MQLPEVSIRRPVFATVKRFPDADEVVGMEILSPGATILTVTANGYGKRTPLQDYRVQNRGGQGVITIRTSDRNGPVIGVAQVVDADEVMLITNGGKVLRCRVSGISTMGRVTQGVRLMEMGDGERGVAIARLAEGDDASATAANGNGATAPVAGNGAVAAPESDAPSDDEPEG